MKIRQLHCHAFHLRSALSHSTARRGSRTWTTSTIFSSQLPLSACTTPFSSTTPSINSLLVVHLHCFSSTSAAGVNNMAKLGYVTPSELRLMLEQQKQDFPGHEDVQIIDVRDADRAEGGHIPTSLHVASMSFRKRLPSLVENFKGTKKTLVFHCMYSQSRGPACARLFADAIGEDDPCKVRILRGGFIGWETECPDMVEEKTTCDVEAGPRKFYVFEEEEKQNVSES